VVVAVLESRPCEQYLSDRVLFGGHDIALDFLAGHLIVFAKTLARTSSGNLYLSVPGSRIDKYWQNRAY